MRRYETRIEKVERTFLVSVTCDLCGRDALRKNGAWGTHAYDATEVEVSLREGESYPEGGGGTIYEIDLCPECFKERLIPWLRSEGATVEQKEWEC